MFQNIVGAFDLEQVQCIFPQLSSFMIVVVRQNVYVLWYYMHDIKVYQTEKYASMIYTHYMAWWQLPAKYSSFFSGCFLSSFLADFLTHSTSRLKVIFKCWWTIKDVKYWSTHLQDCKLAPCLGSSSEALSAIAITRKAGCLPYRKGIYALYTSTHFGKKCLVCNST